MDEDETLIEAAKLRGGKSRTFVNWKIRYRNSGKMTGSPVNSELSGGRVRQSGGRVEAGSGPDQSRLTGKEVRHPSVSIIVTNSSPPWPLASSLHISGR